MEANNLCFHNVLYFTFTCHIEAFRREARKNDIVSSANNGLLPTEKDWSFHNRAKTLCSLALTHD